jgi:hypothetical protein
MILITGLFEGLARMFTKRGLLYWMITLMVVILAAARLLRFSLQRAIEIYRRNFRDYVADTRRDFLSAPPLQHVRKAESRQKDGEQEVVLGL